jgi:hypothetical protein
MKKIICSIYDRHALKYDLGFQEVSIGNSARGDSSACS